jgi:hypothetical protein
MSNPTLVFLREHIFFIEQLLEDHQVHLSLIDETTEAGHPVRRTALLEGLQDRMQSLLDAYRVAANSVSYLN